MTSDTYDPTRPGPPREVAEDAAARERSMSENLPEKLARELVRVTQVRENYRRLRSAPNVIVEPQIAMMDKVIEDDCKADAITRLRAENARLRGALERQGIALRDVMQSGVGGIMVHMGDNELRSVTELEREIRATLQETADD